MIVTFIMPAIGRREGEEYLKTWQMEPLPIAQVAGLTPKGITIKFFDDRVEDINYEEKTDVVAITTETYTAKRAYEIAKIYKEKKVVVVMGGFHATLLPQEVRKYADIVAEGEAEEIWPRIIKDIQRRSYKKIYKSNKRPSLENLTPNREIFNGKKYLPITLIESARGCKFNCSFCSIATFYHNTYNTRPVSDVINEIKKIKKKNIFFIDDNICADIKRTKELLKSLIPLHVNWVGQASLVITQNEELLDLMKASGCAGVLIGFESLNKDNLKQMNKNWNRGEENYHEALLKLTKRGIAIYGSFVFGHDNDDSSVFEKTLKFTIKEKFFLTAFNHLVPFPGTPLYEQLKDKKRLLSDTWWLNKDYKFGDVAFQPKKITAQELSHLAFLYKKKFYSLPSIIKRGVNFKSNCKNIKMATNFFLINLLFRSEVSKRKGIPLGKNEMRED